MGNLPAVLGQFLLTAIAVVVQAAIAILFDFILAIFVIMQNAGGGLLSQGNSTALYDPVYIAMNAGSEFTLINGEVLSTNILDLPTTFIPLFFLSYLGIASVKAFIDILTGGDGKAFISLYKVGVFTLLFLLLLGAGYNAFLDIAISGRTTEYTQEIQWALPANIYKTTPDVPVFSLTNIVLSANLTATNNLGVKMAASDVATLTGISAFTYFMAILSAGGVDQLVYLLIMLVQFVGRNLFSVFLLTVAGYQFLKEIPILGDITRHIGGVVILAVFIIPLMASFTGGGAFAMPVALAQFNAAQSERVRSALAITSVDAYDKDSICQALVGEPGASCPWLPNSGGEEFASSGDRDEMMSAFTGLMMETFLASVALIVINVLQLTVLRAAHFGGTYITGVGLSSMAAYGAGQRGFTSTIWKEEYQKAVSINGSYGQAVNKVLSPIGDALRDMARGGSKGSGSFSQTTRTEVRGEVSIDGQGGRGGEVDQQMIEGLNRLAAQSEAHRRRRPHDDSQSHITSDQGFTQRSNASGVTCAYCGTSNNSDKDFCQSCGASLEYEEAANAAL